MFFKYCISKKKSSCKVVVGFAARQEKVPWFFKKNVHHRTVHIILSLPFIA